MPLKIVRNDITKMQCDALVNTANEYPVVGRGCDTAIYEAAGYEQLLSYRKEHIGKVKEGDVFLTPAFALPARYIIHAVSPAFHGGDRGEERKLRACYKKSLELARQEKCRSIAFPLIATGSYRYPKEEGLRIAVDEINAFLLQHSMEVFLVVYDEMAAELGKRLAPDLKSYLADAMEVREEAVYYDRREQAWLDDSERIDREESCWENTGRIDREAFSGFNRPLGAPAAPLPKASASMPKPAAPGRKGRTPAPQSSSASLPDKVNASAPIPDFYAGYDSKLEERIKHLSDTFSEYLMYLIRSKGLTNADVYKKAIVDKKVFSKIKNNKHAHPSKMTAMCLCVGARLNIDETRDLLARAGYALSPCDMTDMIFSFFIENGIYDMFELDIQLEDHGLPCLIS